MSFMDRINPAKAAAAPAKRLSDSTLAIEPIWLEWLTLGGMLAFGGWLLGGTQTPELMEWQ